MVPTTLQSFQRMSAETIVKSGVTLNYFFKFSLLSKRISSEIIRASQNSAFNLRSRNKVNILSSVLKLIPFSHFCLSDFNPRIKELKSAF